MPSSCASTNAKHILSGARTAHHRQEKAAKVEEVSALVASAQTIVVAEYRGLDVDSATKTLRKQARSQGVQLRVLKNTLARRAMSGTAFAGLSDKLVGPLVYGFSADPVAAAKVLSSFAKDNDKLVVKAGAMPNFVMAAKGVGASGHACPAARNSWPSSWRTMQAPIAQFVRTLNEVPTRTRSRAGRGARQAGCLSQMAGSLTDDPYRRYCPESEAQLHRSQYTWTVSRTQEILDAIAAKTGARDQSGLIKQMEEKFGVSAAAAAVAVAAPAAGGGRCRAEEQTEFNVELTEAGANKLNVIKARSAKSCPAWASKKPRTWSMAPPRSSRKAFPRTKKLPRSRKSSKPLAPRSTIK